MIIYDPSTARTIGIALVQSQDFFDANLDALPFLNASPDGPIELSIVQAQVPSLDLFDSNQQDNLTTVSQDITNYNFGLVEQMHINDIELFEEVNTFTY